MPEINLQNIPGRLSRKAQTVVQLLDGAIRLYQDRRKPLTTIRLYRRDYQTLDAALRKLTQGGGRAFHTLLPWPAGGVL